MIPTIIELLFYYKFENDQIVDIPGSDVDDLLRARDNGWERQAHSTLESFEGAGDKQTSFPFVRMNISEKDDIIETDKDL